MKIHSFVRDSKLMEKNENEAIEQRSGFIKRLRKSQPEHPVQIAEQQEQSTENEVQKTRQKKKKEAI